MAKFKLKIKAQKLRKAGNSIGDIAKSLSVSKGSASLWCKDIRLTKIQLKKLLNSKNKQLTAGRLKGALVQRNKKLEAIKEAKNEAKQLQKLTKSEFWIAGLALYLAEGSKTYGTVQFTNSNPNVIKFMFNWFIKIFDIRRDDFRCSVLVNIIHKKREEEIIKFWQNFLKINDSHFTATKYVKAKQKKIYKNKNNYFGTFNFRIRKSTKLLYKLNAFINNLLLAKID